MGRNANPWREATKSEAEMGNAAFRTLCPSRRRRTVAETPARLTLPDRADTSAEGDRADIGAFEKKMVRRIYYNLEK